MSILYRGSKLINKPEIDSSDKGIDRTYSEHDFNVTKCVDKD